MSKRGSYAGSTVIKFTVERIKDNNSDEIQEIELEVYGRASYTPGVTWKKPEDCYPDEGEVSIISITGPKGQAWSESDLTKKEYDAIIEKIDDSVKCDDRYEPYD